MFVLDEGRPDGPAVLLLHGVASSLRAWDALVPLLVGDVRLVRVDLLGHGRTGGPGGDAVTQARALTAVLDQRRLTHVTVVGHSFGADIGLDLAAVDARIARVVVVSQGADYSGAPIPRLRFLTSRPALIRRLHRALRPVLGLVARLPFLSPVIRQGVRDVRVTDPGMLRIVLHDRRKSLAVDPLDARAAAIARPVLVVLGGRDRLYGTRSAARYRAAGAEVEIIAASNHAMPQQQPAAVAALLRAFVR